MIVRVANFEDLEVICDLNRDDLGYDSSYVETVERYDGVKDDVNQVLYVAVESQRVIGYVHAVVYHSLYMPLAVDIRGIAVSSKDKRKGAGRALLEAVESWSRSQGIMLVRLVSGETRLGAHDFYQRCGYSYNKAQYNFSKKIGIMEL